MYLRKKQSRRTIFKTGIASLVAATFTSKQALASWKAPGETRVILLGGDFYHNAVAQEQTWRRVLSATDWRLMFAQDSDFITPDVLAKADLFILTRYATDTQPVNFSLGFSPDRFVEDRQTPSIFMSDEQETAIIENVRRGMGLLSIHCSIWNPKKTNYMDLLGVEKPIMHTPVQQALIHELNQTHPITKGIEPFKISDDEIFNAVLKSGESELLYKTRGDEFEINANGGWCRDEGKGRVVSLLPGHTQGPYMQKSFREIMWRSAYWAMRKNIPASNHITENY